MEESGSPPASHSEDNKKLWRGWLSNGGTLWFDRLAHLAQHDAAAADWLQAVCQGLTVQCYPCGTGFGSWQWPRQAESPPGKVECRTGGSASRIIQVGRYATDPAHVICTWEAPQELVDYYEQTRVLLQQAREQGLHTLADACKRELSRLLAEGQLPSREHVIQIIDSVDSPEITPPAQPDMLSAGLHQWLSFQGWKMFPLSEGYPADAEDRPDRYRFRPIFKKDVPAKTLLGVWSFGLEDAQGTIVRPAELQVSAGPPPAGLKELEAMARQAPDEIGPRLQKMLRDFRQAGLHGNLEQKVVDLFKLYWEIRSQWMLSDSQAAQQFGDHLAGMLQEAFGITTFEPSTDRDFPQGWLIYPPGTRLIKGHVTRILRPGLRCQADGSLRLPAYVEAE